MRHEYYEEFVPVEDEFKGRIIGHRKHTIKKIEKESDASIEVHPKGFSVTGSDQEREDAKRLIQQIVVGLNADV